MAGRSFCMIYALIGIPLGLVMFQSIGERLNTFVGSALKYAKECFKAKNPEVTQTNLVMVVSVLSTILMTSMAAVFAKYERWEYFDALYYCFITLTTIGFGDYVALQKESALQSKPEYVALSLIFILFGLSVVSSAVNLLVLKFLTLNTADELRDEQLRYTANLNPIQLEGDVITSTGGGAQHLPRSPQNSFAIAPLGGVGRKQLMAPPSSQVVGQPVPFERHLRLQSANCDHETESQLDSPNARSASSYHIGATNGIHCCAALHHYAKQTSDSDSIDSSENEDDDEEDEEEEEEEEGARGDDEDTCSNQALTSTSVKRMRLMPNHSAAYRHTKSLQLKCFSHDDLQPQQLQQHQLYPRANNSASCIEAEPNKPLEFHHHSHHLPALTSSTRHLYHQHQPLTFHHGQSQSHRHKQISGCASALAHGSHPVSPRSNHEPLKPCRSLPPCQHYRRQRCGNYRHRHRRLYHQQQVEQPQEVDSQPQTRTARLHRNEIVTVEAQVNATQLHRYQRSSFHRVTSRQQQQQRGRIDSDGKISQGDEPAMSESSCSWLSATNSTDSSVGLQARTSVPCQQCQLKLFESNGLFHYSTNHHYQHHHPHNRQGSRTKKSQHRQDEWTTLYAPTTCSAHRSHHLHQPRHPTQWNGSAATTYPDDAADSRRGSSRTLTTSVSRLRPPPTSSTQALADGHAVSSARVLTTARRPTRSSSSASLGVSKEPAPIGAGPNSVCDRCCQHQECIEHALRARAHSTSVTASNRQHVVASPPAPSTSPESSQQTLIVRDGTRFTGGPMPTGSDDATIQVTTQPDAMQTATTITEILPASDANNNEAKLYDKENVANA